MFCLHICAPSPPAWLCWGSPFPHQSWVPWLPAGTPPFMAAGKQSWGDWCLGQAAGSKGNMFSKFSAIQPMKVWAVQPMELGAIQPMKVGAIQPMKVGAIQPMKVGGYPAHEMGAIQPMKVGAIQPMKVGGYPAHESWGLSSP